MRLLVAGPMSEEDDHFTPIVSSISQAVTESLGTPPYARSGRVLLQHIVHIVGGSRLPVGTGRTIIEKELDASYRINRIRPIHPRLNLLRRNIRQTIVVTIAYNFFRLKYCCRGT